jgi:hypothetical protein
VSFGFIIIAEMQSFLWLSERVKWSCDKCISERAQVLKRELQNVLRQI